MEDADDRVEVIEQAPAKINLYLHVNHRRDDGYHDLESLVVFTEFGDVVRLSPASSLEVIRTGPFAAQLPDDPEDDLCLRAARLLAAQFGCDASLRISLEKNIPVAAGVGGGSSDAAAVLRGLSRLWSIDPADPKVIDIAEGLGADVPVCLRGEAAVIRGVGDILTPLRTAPSLNLLLVNPNLPLSTASVFHGWASTVNAGASRATSGPDLAGQELLETLALARNDLAMPAIELCPVIGDILSELSDLPGCHLARMSGSGPTCFAVFETTDGCAQAGGVLAQRRPDWWISPTATRLPA